MMWEVEVRPASSHVALPGNWRRPGTTATNVAVIAACMTLLPIGLATTAKNPVVVTSLIRIDAGSAPSADGVITTTGTAAKGYVKDKLVHIPLCNVTLFISISAIPPKAVVVVVVVVLVVAARPKPLDHDRMLALSAMCALSVSQYISSSMKISTEELDKADTLSQPPLLPFREIWLPSTSGSIVIKSVDRLTVVAPSSKPMTTSPLNTASYVTSPEAVLKNPCPTSMAT
mmetsp:Transcript_53878/g.120516  ORF Transcript_53878/g.120516 Transcript_53878/m.120516 type:complete len:230 (-) Transcript_53878:332-1021(-)